MKPGTRLTVVCLVGIVADMSLRKTWLELAAGLLIGLVPAMHAESANAAHGKYLVERVTLCFNCHTPKLADGEPDRSKWLKGSEIAFEPTHPVKDWNKSAPDLTPSGRLWQKWGEKAITHFLETGLGPSGHRADPPMPWYRLKPSDAQALVAYLKTLK